MAYSVIEVPLDAPTQLEQLGTKGKFWYRAGNGSRTLFKEGRPGTGENWAEKVSCEIAHLLGLPHAHYDLAVCNGRHGVSTPSMVPDEGRLILGNELLAWSFELYDPVAAYRAGQHTFRRVVAVLRNPEIRTPLGWVCPADVSGAVGVFTGYLLLDALVGNQDRHHENWGLIYTQDSGLSLAPTFDHASSLGRNETDAARLERLRTHDVGHSVAHYAARARSALYETPTDKKAMSTLEAFVSALKVAPEAGRYWLKQLSSIDPEGFSDVLAKIPGDWMSLTALNFAHAMLVTNRNRLLELDT
jgi:hypothetical protein